MKKSLFLVLIVLGIATIGGVLYYLSSAQKTEEAAQKNVEMLADPDNGSEIVTETPVYFENVSGFLAKPEKEGRYPGVVMIHEWWGLNDNIRAMARELASEGYIVLAADLYEGEATDNPERARELSSSIDQERATRNLRAATVYLREKEGAERTASLGWCFGGGQSLQLSLSGEPMDATVIYYGQLIDDPDRLSAIQWPVLGIFGEEDRSIPVESVNIFRAMLNGLRIENEIHVYPGVGHAFANPTGDNYAPEETQDAWNKTLEFLERNLKD